MSRLAIVVIGAVCFLLIPVSEAASKCTSVQAQWANVIPIPADGFMEGIWESSPAAPRWPSTTAFRASCLKSASDRKATRRVL